jgi:hypothetical protein
MTGLFDISTMPFYREHNVRDRPVWFIYNAVLIEKT